MPRATTILPERTDFLLMALAGSLLVHLLAFAILDVGIRLAWWSPQILPAFLRPISSLPPVKVPMLKSASDREPLPLLFVSVSPEQASDDAPKDTKYYSSASSRAANQEIKVESNIPNIAGTQTKMIRTEDTPREKAFPLQPTPAPAPEPKTKAPPAPKAAPKPGDLAAAKPAMSPTLSDDVNKRLGEPSEPRIRPRTIEEAKRMLNPSLAGDKMKQEGGVKNRGKIEGLDVRQSPFGRYDEAFIKAVQNRWYDLIDERRFAALVAGAVVVKFRLNYNGRITDARVESTSVDVIMTHLCQKAIEDPQPYEPWPGDMRRMIGANYRELTFTFHYN